MKLLYHRLKFFSTRDIYYHFKSLIIPLILIKKRTVLSTILLYIIFKIKGYIDRKNKKNRTINYTAEYKESYNRDNIENIDDSIVEVIDVDYEDVDK